MREIYLVTMCFVYPEDFIIFKFVLPTQNIWNAETQQHCNILSQNGD